MNKYPKALTYSAWLETVIFKLPSNLILKILYSPFYLVGLIFVFIAENLVPELGIIGIIFFYIVFAPIYGIYLLFFTFKRMIVSQKKLMVIIDESNRKFVKVKDINNPTKDGFLFLNWELEDKTKFDDLWKLPSGTKLFAKWESNNPVIPKVNEPKAHEGFFLKLTGVTIGKRQENIKKIKSNDELIYLREPLNPYDKNAILIKTKDGLDLGYIPKLNNSQLAENIDKGIKYRISVSVVTGTGNEYRGVNVYILQENQNLKSNQSNNPISTQRSTRSFVESIDFDTPFLNFDNDDYSSIENSLADSDDDGGYEPETNVDFDFFDSDL
jgi:hypothetical protein